MALLQIAEVFGHDTSLSWTKEERTSRRCPFMGSACTKQSVSEPLGICSYTDGKFATAVCPVRFRENGRIFRDAGRAAFGEGKRIFAVPEVRLLSIPHATKKKSKKIGKIDFLIALLDEFDEPIDFAAVEVQAVYISGKSTRPPFERFLSTGELSEAGRRRPDFRSSAQKRLMPQLSLKVPVFRRWGKRFFVAVDSSFFAELPKLPTVSKDNAEISWLVYSFEQDSQGFAMREPTIYHTLWDDVLTSLREGTPPSREELLAELREAIKADQILST